jgi:hypothetical protein
MMEKSTVSRNNVIILLSIFIGVALLIFTQSYFFGAYISYDSTGYLRVAEVLRNGYGFRMNALAGDMQSYFSGQPIAYPAMIAVVALITNTEIYLASKILSIIILSIIAILFFVKFKNHAWLYALVMTNYGFLQIFWFTWSEQPFILGLIWLSFALADILKSEKIKYVHYINITLASLFLFFSRYIGAFSIGIIGLTALYQMYTGISKHNKESIKKAFLLGICAGVAVTVMALYLFNNYKHSGYTTGTARLPEENHLRLFFVFCEAQLRELQNVFFLFFDMSRRTAFLLYTMSAVICFHFFYLKRRNFYKNISADTVSFTAVGAIYWLSIVVIRFLASFDDFYFRLLFPASALLFLGLVEILSRRYANRIESAVNSVCGLLFTALLMATIGSYAARPLFNKYYKHENVRGYTQIRAEIMHELSEVPSGSVVISWGGKIFSNFMRPDTLAHRVYRLPITGIDYIFEQAKQTEREVYLLVDWTQMQDDEKETFESFIAQYGNDRAAQISETLTRLR